MAAATQQFLAFSLLGPTTVGPLAVGAGRSRFYIVFSLTGLLGGQVVWLSIELSTDGGVTWQNACTADVTVATGTADLAFSLGTDAQGAQVLSGAGWQMRGVLTPVNGPVLLGVGTLSAT